jgi:hypothetical protein
MPTMGDIRKNQPFDLKVTGKQNPNTVTGFWVVQVGQIVKKTAAIDVMPNTVFLRNFTAADVATGAFFSVVMRLPDDGSCTVDLELKQAPPPFRKRLLKTNLVWTFRLV